MNRCGVGVIRWNRSTVAALRFMLVIATAEGDTNRCKISRRCWVGLADQRKTGLPLDVDLGRIAVFITKDQGFTENLANWAREIHFNISLFHSRADSGLPVSRANFVLVGDDNGSTLFPTLLVRANFAGLNTNVLALTPLLILDRLSLSVKQAEHE